MSVKVKEVMKRYVVTVEPTFTIYAAAKILSNNRIGSVVVVENDKPVGIVTNEDIVSIVARGKSPKNTKLEEFTKREFITASPDDDLLKITKTMIKKKIKRIPILKEGKLAGIITDKEILLAAPEMIDILSEKLKARVEHVARPDTPIPGICEGCEGYSGTLYCITGRWFCEDCRDR